MIAPSARLAMPKAAWERGNPTQTTLFSVGLALAAFFSPPIAPRFSPGSISLAPPETTADSGRAPGIFPLRVVAGQRYLVDATGAPFLIHGDSPWSLIAQLTREQIDQYLEDRRLKGFNAILVELIEHKFSSNAPNNIYGAAPFLAPGDFSTPNEAYFAHAEYAVRKAAEKGILVMLAPMYLGYEGGDQGWYQQTLTNSVAVVEEYGRYLATRFRNFENILWVHGGDFAPPKLDKVRALASAIRRVDDKWLHTFNGARSSSALGLASSEGWVSLNNIYTTTDVAPAAAAEYSRSTMPFFLVEAIYENEGADDLTVRRQAYQAVLGGATGHLFGNRPIWLMGPGWQAALGSPASTTLPHLRRLLEAHQWWTLVPDGRKLLSGGFGTAPAQTTVSLASDRRFAIGYTPAVRTLTFDLAKLVGPRVRVRWYDPTNGVYSEAVGSPFKASSVTVRPVGTNSRGLGDWALVLESIP